MRVSETSAAAVAALFLVLALDVADAGHASAASAGIPTGTAFIGGRILHIHRLSESMRVLSVRGGATVVDDDDYDSDVDEYDSEMEEEEEERALKLSRSTLKAAAKAKTKKSAATKKAVSATLTQTKPKKRRASLLKVLHVPYIVRACLNPFTFFAMTRAYFASLFNIDYMVEESSQTLRSALEEKAKKAGAAGGKKPKRTFKPGQAKTLSDLPQLSA